MAFLIIYKFKSVFIPTAMISTPPFCADLVLHKLVLMLVHGIMKHTYKGSSSVYKLVNSPFNCLRGRRFFGGTLNSSRIWYSKGKNKKLSSIVLKKNIPRRGNRQYSIIKYIIEKLIIII